MGAGEEKLRRGSFATGRARSGSLAAFIPFSSKDNSESRRIPSGSGTTPDGLENHTHEQGFPEAEREQMEEFLNSLQGHLGE